MSGLAIHGGTPVVPRERHRLWPVITAADRQAVLGVLDRGVLCGPFAPEVRALEEAFAETVGVRHCLATNSGTAALHMAVAAAGVGPGDEVITSAFSFIATPLAVVHHNAVPVFVDIEPATLTLDPARIEERITDRTRAIIPVHIHGLPADMAAVRVVAARHGLVVIEDAAQAHGALYRGRPVGSLGEMGIFSLNATKTLPAGEGGLFVTSDDVLVERARRLRFDGEAASGDAAARWDPTRPLDDTLDYRAEGIGWMYLMPELTAAFARSQLARLDDHVATAQGNAALLSAGLKDLEAVTVPAVPADRTHVFHKYRVRLHPERLGLDIPPARFRDMVLTALQAEGVEAVLWQTMPLPAQPLFRRLEGYGRGCPWDCQGRATVRYRPEEYPETIRLLDGSVVIGSQSYPLCCQPPELMGAYVGAFHKVFAHVDQLLKVPVGR